MTTLSGGGRIKVKIRFSCGLFDSNKVKDSAIVNLAIHKNNKNMNNFERRFDQFYFPQENQEDEKPGEKQASEKGLDVLLNQQQEQTGENAIEIPVKEKAGEEVAEKLTPLESLNKEAEALAQSMENAFKTGEELVEKLKNPALKDEERKVLISQTEPLVKMVGEEQRIIFFAGEDLENTRLEKRKRLVNTDLKHKIEDLLNIREPKYDTLADYVIRKDNNPYGSRDSLFMELRSLAWQRDKDNALEYIKKYPEKALELGKKYDRNNDIFLAGDLAREEPEFSKITQKAESIIKEIDDQINEEYKNEHNYTLKEAIDSNNIVLGKFFTKDGKDYSKGYNKIRQLDSIIGTRYTF